MLAQHGIRGENSEKVIAELNVLSIIKDKESPENIRKFFRIFDDLRSGKIVSDNEKEFIIKYLNFKGNKTELRQAEFSMEQWICKGKLTPEAVMRDILHI